MAKFNRKHVMVAAAAVLSAAGGVLIVRGVSGRGGGNADTMVIEGAPAAARHNAAAFPVFAVIPAREYDQLHAARDYGTHLGYTNDGAWASYRVDFGEGATAVAVKTGVPEGRTNARIQLRLDAPDGQLIGDIRLKPTGGDGLYASVWQEAPLQPVRGVHKVYLTSLAGGSMGNLSAIRFVRDPQPATSLIRFDAYEELAGIEDQGERLGSLDRGDWARFRKLDFGSGLTWLNATVGVPAEFAGKRLEFRLDRPDGPIIAEVTMQSTGGWGAGRAVRVPVTPVPGVHDLYVTPVGNSVGSLFSFRFEQ